MSVVDLRKVRVVVVHRRVQIGRVCYQVEGGKGCAAVLLAALLTYSKS